MLYNTLGKTNLKVSRLGFGTMRLPTKGSNDQIVEDEATEMLTYGIENGINLIDTAYPYHNVELSGSGNSEIFLGNFLKENSYRDDIILSTKSPTWAIEKKEDFDTFLDEQLKKLQTDYIDIYLLHSLTEPIWAHINDLNVLDFLDDCLSSGVVKHIGFSSHIEVDYLIEILDEYPKWEVALTQMNYLDEYYQSGVMGLNYLKEINVGSMIMEPLRGGRLVNNIPEEVKAWWEIAEVKRTPVEWALQYLWNRDDVDCVLSGMTSLKQVKENIKYASNEDIINEYDQEIIREVARQYKASSLGNDCTRCGYCMPCPEGVDIVNCLTEYNIAQMMRDPKASAMQYFSLIGENSRADSCISCEKCLPFCTQMLNIPEELQKVYEYFGSEFDHF
ncbi:MAG: aldo/keto reductase [Methanobrevibacter sp.]|uniref:aldo/keto reductase n=1 Tax=Methanobrevibacter sp. TaxID=66852 RepID=UPI002600D778|nr:aldo/keto reductase [Methanobrevibacter sp.]MBQ6099567.1 aldo/keto reductase [Methanobrevibacter sp.]MBQ6100424.1 aldo/keto reductase [Methanobrevibacter sp.]